MKVSRCVTIVVTVTGTTRPASYNVDFASPTHLWEDRCTIAPAGINNVSITPSHFVEPHYFLVANSVIIKYNQFERVPTTFIFIYQMVPSWLNPHRIGLRQHTLTTFYIGIEVSVLALPVKCSKAVT